MAVPDGFLDRLKALSWLLDGPEANLTEALWIDDKLQPAPFREKGKRRWRNTPESRFLIEVAREDRRDLWERFGKPRIDSWFPSLVLSDMVCSL